MSEQDLDTLNLTDDDLAEILDPKEESAEEDNDNSDEEVKAQLQKKDAIIRQMHARAVKAEQAIKQAVVEKPIIKKQESKQDDIRQTVQELKLAEEKRQFGYENNLSPEATDYLFKISPNPTKELLEDPFVKGGLEAIKAKKRVDENTPSLNSRSPRFELPKKKDLTMEDKQEAFDNYRKEKFGK